MNKGSILGTLVIIGILSAACATDRKPPLPAPAVITANVANMHSAASAGTDVVSQALLGMNVQVLDKAPGAAGGTWYRIETPDAYQGWIDGRDIRLLKRDERPYAANGPVFVVSSLFANIYDEPDVTTHKPMAIAPISSVLVMVRRVDDRWFEIVLPDGGRGFIQNGDGLTGKAPFSWPRITAEATAELARRFLGLPYLWGGGSPLGLDCSGFVQLLYRMSGVPILRDAGIQMEGSGLLPVARGAERNGDLVFFGKAPDRISHVGLMINDREFIHATTYLKPVVQISALADAHWQGLLQAARRPAN